MSDFLFGNLKPEIKIKHLSGTSVNLFKKEGGFT